MAVVSVLAENVWDPIVSRLERWVRRVASDVPTETDWSQSIKGSWYIHPRQHAVEMVVLSTAFSCASLYFVRDALGPGTLNSMLLSGFVPPGPPSWREKVLLVSLVGSLGLTLVHKVKRKAVLFMLQPCHMSALLLILTMTMDKRTAMPHLLFNIYLYTQWGAIAALVFPDVRDHYLWGETFNFFAEHILILAAPIYMICSTRYLILPASPAMALLSFSIYSFFHSPVLHLCALKSGLNLNYLFTPPPINFLIRLGPMYRLALYGAALAAMFTTRYVLVGGILSLLRRSPLSTMLSRKIL